MATHKLNTIGGEFADPAREAAFQADRLPELVRHVQLCFAAASALNALGLVVDYRFVVDHPEFWIAIPARLCIVAVSLTALGLVGRSKCFEALERVVLAWEAIAGFAAGALCVSHIDLALMGSIVVPAIFMLAMPTRFRWTATVGPTAAAGLTVVYLLGRPQLTPFALPATTEGMVSVSLIMLATSLLVVVRSNRGRRLEWIAIQDARRANADLAESRQLFETVFRAVPVPIILSRQGDGRILGVNDAACNFHGLTEADGLMRRTIRDLLNRDERHRIQASLDRYGSVSNVELNVATLAGHNRDIMLSSATAIIDGVPCIVTSLVDITSRKAAEAQIRIAAHHDALTGLPNRALFQTTIETALANADASGARVGVILLDLDAFKEINDTLGHGAGDALLKEVADRIEQSMHAGDFVARLGGDEFVIIVACEADASRPSTRVHAVTETILTVLAAPMRIAGRIIVPRASLGLAVFPEHAATSADLLTNADLALYAAKGAGRNRATLFEPALRARVEARVAIIREMRVALEEGGLVPFYQPKIDLATGRVIGFEALARWRHPIRGLLTPDAFSEIFDDSDIGIAVGRCMVRQIASDVADWVRQGLEPGRVFLNLSSAQFSQTDLTGDILAHLARSGLAHDRIGVEVTETVLLGANGDRVTPALRALHAAGIRIALDDFGTGYASLTHLKQYPVDEIKIDRSFVRDLERDANDAAIVAAVLQLGLSLGLDVTAEGVETDAQSRFLAERGCAFAQGYLYSKAMPGSRVPLFLAVHAAQSLDYADEGALRLA